ncbi:MAG: hypothetical protein QW077_07685 [Candidatus Caldarchaeum sp.]
MTQFSILRPKMVGYGVVREEAGKERRARERKMAEILDGILLGWLLRR